MDVKLNAVRNPMAEVDVQNLQQAVPPVSTQQQPAQGAGVATDGATLSETLQSRVETRGGAPSSVSSGAGPALVGPADAENETRRLREELGRMGGESAAGMVNTSSESVLKLFG